MGKVVPYRPKCVVDFEGRALKRVAGLTVLALRIPEIIHDLGGSLGPAGPTQGLGALVDLMSALDEAMRCIEACESELSDEMMDGEESEYEAESDQNDLRVVLHVSKRCSMFYISDFRFESVNAATVRQRRTKRSRA